MGWLQSVRKSMLRWLAAAWLSGKTCGASMLILGLAITNLLALDLN